MAGDSKVGKLIKTGYGKLLVWVLKTVALDWPLASLANGPSNATVWEFGLGKYETMPYFINGDWFIKVAAGMYWHWMRCVGLFQCFTGSDFSLQPNLSAINRIFIQPRLEDIIQSLREDNSEWARDTLQTILNHVRVYSSKVGLLFYCLIVACGPREISCYNNCVNILLSNNNKANKTDFEAGISFIWAFTFLNNLLKKFHIGRVYYQVFWRKLRAHIFSK